jgi:mannan endo-1,4-beta-mannosidase
MGTWKTAMVLLVLMAPASLLVTSCKATPPQAIHLAAEQGILTGVNIQTKIPGYTGSGYVDGFVNNTDKVSWSIANAAPGLYTVTIRYSSPTGVKGYDMAVNGAKMSGMFAATGQNFATQDAGKVELTAGPNTLEIDRGWGYFEINSVTLTPAPPPAPLPKLSARLSDPLAGPATRALMASLIHLYGQKTLSGQHELGDTRYIQATTGRTPAIFEGDLIDYSPSRVAHGTHSTETAQIIQQAKAGQIAAVLWHWNAPTDLIDKSFVDTNGKTVEAQWYFGFYTRATTFNLKEALADPKSADYALLLRDMDVIAGQLKLLQDAGVPVLWRPLHEAEGGWFWWGAQGPEAFKQLWRLMYTRFTKVHHLHNLIWVDCSSTNPDWYPGDAYVDIIGTDAYPSDVSDPLSSTWDTLFKEYGTRKPLALTEFGGVPDVDKMRRYGVRWSYFSSWSGYVGPDKMSPDAVKRIYTSPNVVTLGPLGH